MPLPCDSNNNDEDASENVSSPIDQQQNQISIQHVLSRPNLCSELRHRIHMSDLTAPVQQLQSYVPDTQMLHQNQQPPVMLQVSATHQQQQTSHLMNSYQPDNVTPSQSYSRSSIDSNAQQLSTQTEDLEILNDTLTQSDIDFFDLITTDQVKENDCSIYQIKHRLDTEN